MIPITVPSSRSAIDLGQYGLWCRLDARLLAEAVSSAGYDWVCFDLQHGLATYGDVLAAAGYLAGTETSLVVRVASNDASLIGKALDAGARAVIVPMIETAVQVEDSVAACSYQPRGRRSFAGLGIGGRDPHLADRSVFCGVMIETEGAVEQLPEILAVDGLDFVFVGPDDLALALTGQEQGGGESLDSVLRSVPDACAAQGVVAGIFCGNAGETVTRGEQGYQLLAVATDVTMIRETAASALRQIKADMATPAGR